MTRILKKIENHFIAELTEDVKGAGKQFDQFYIRSWDQERFNKRYFVMCYSKARGNGRRRGIDIQASKLKLVEP